MRLLGRHLDYAAKHDAHADAIIANVRTDPDWTKSFGLHASSDAINAGFTTQVCVSLCLCVGVWACLCFCVHVRILNPNHTKHLLGRT